MTIDLRKVAKDDLTCLGLYQHYGTLTFRTHFHNEMYYYILLYLTKQHVGSDGRHDQRVTLESAPVRDFLSWVN
jgi:hypothetical protein